MVDKTHIALGMASALLILHPTSNPELVTTMIGGAIGGWIPDIDCVKNNKSSDRMFASIAGITVLSIAMGIDYWIGSGICAYVIRHWNITMIIAILGIIGLMLFASSTDHRSFTHSFLAYGLFSTCVFVAFRPAFIAFLIGYASHLIADSFNFRGLQLFYPMKRKYSLKMCTYRSKANTYTFWTSIVIDVFYIGFILWKIY